MATALFYHLPMTENGDFRPGRRVVSALHIHLVFVTKYRWGVLDKAMLCCCENAMRKICGDFGAELGEVNGGGRSCATASALPTEGGHLGPE
jgi:hypothetical protein